MGEELLGRAHTIVELDVGVAAGIGCIAIFLADAHGGGGLGSVDKLTIAIGFGKAITVQIRSDEMGAARRLAG